MAEGPYASNPVGLSEKGPASRSAVRRIGDDAETAALAVDVRSYAAFAAHYFFSLRGAIPVCVPAAQAEVARRQDWLKHTPMLSS